MKENNIIVLGGGASGMLCALLLKQKCSKNITVTLLERGERLGKKLSSTGNGQGNITNRNFGVKHYFTDDRKKVESVLCAFDDHKLLAFFENLGGLFEQDEKGRVYPTGRQASALTDLLRFALADLGVNIVNDCKIEKITHKKGKFNLQSESGTNYQSDVLVMATGGKAAKNFGTDGLGYELATALGHSVTPLYPALVQLKTDTTYIKGLRGVRTDCGVTAILNDKKSKGDTHARVFARGDVIFTDYGVSGNAIFTLSSYLTDQKDGGLELDFLPDVSEEKLTEILTRKQKNSPQSELLGCILNNQLGRSVMRRVQAETGGSAAALVAKYVKHFTLKVTGSLGFDQAQVTRGGIPMSEVTDNLESKICSELYFTGEILNVDGECGGYNLQWAFSSAVRVANAIMNKEQD